jgi:exopolysaccharide production protein ExoZ
MPDGNHPGRSQLPWDGLAGSMARSRITTLDSLQALRAAAALLVVLSHIGQAHGLDSKLFGNENLGPLRALAGHLGGTGVDLFFVISGLIMVLTTAAAQRGPEGAAHFLWRRAARIYPPYLAITAVLAAV